VGQAPEFAAADGSFKKVNVNVSTIASTAAKWRCMPRLPALASRFWGEPCRPFIDRGELQEVTLELPPAPLQLSALYRERHFMPARTRVWLEFIQSQMAS
jgi:DNA-binding transcriptional LysR family regulator